MIKNFGQYLVGFIVLILLQVLVLNNIQFSGFINPYIYVLLILLLPITIPGWLLIIVSFFLGLTIDMFTNTLGVHASATVFMAALRPAVLLALSNRGEYEQGAAPRISTMGLAWFFKYTIVLVFAHHLFLFFIEVFKFNSFYLVLWRTFLSTIFSTLIILLSQFVIFRK